MFIFSEVNLTHHDLIIAVAKSLKPDLHNLTFHNLFSHIAFRYFLNSYWKYDSSVTSHSIFYCSFHNFAAKLTKHDLRLMVCV